jgi:hypothetical protein
MNRQPELVPARWSAIKEAVQRLHAGRVGTNPKTLANHKSNARAALLWFGKEKEVGKWGAPLTTPWALLSRFIPDRNRRKRLSGLMRHCSARAIDPAGVTEEVLDEYMRYRAETTALAVNPAARRKIARAWNACIEDVDGWPQQRLIEPPVEPLTETAWETLLRH